MASNKRAQRLDQSTRDTLNALDAALLMMGCRTIQPGEFTTDEYIAARIQKGDHRTYDGIRFSLERMCKRGELLKRKVVINGKECNAYRLP